MTDPPDQRAAAAFAAELARWRIARGMTKKLLAGRMNFHPSYVSHVEARRHRPTADFARRADAVLGAGGAIWQRFEEYDRLRNLGPQANRRDPVVPGQWLPPGTGLIVEQEVASLTYRDGHYQCVVRRDLYNAGDQPVSRYLVRIAIDRYPHDPERSNQHHRSHPLTLAELNLRAHCGDPLGPEAMNWRVKHDRDAFKEIWLLFENDDGRFPLYPGERTTIEYAYQVGAEKWGPWFQRAVRVPTRHLTIRLDLPAKLKPQVWGVENSFSAEEEPLETPITRRSDGDRLLFEWSTVEPVLHARYRLAWRFRAGRPSTPVPDAGTARPSERMRAVGIVQRPAAVLHQPARQFVLPRDETVALDVVARLRATLTRLENLYQFTKGLGLAAPQLGLPWAAAAVRPPEPCAATVILINPRIVDAGEETDERYEGCLSFFDVRGLVTRPLRIEVEHSRLDGSRVITPFEYAMARLVAHEIDHLEGTLYVDRMAPGLSLIPVEEYREAGRPWHY